MLGAGWLVLKTKGELQDWARRAACVCLVAVLIAIMAVSIWTPLANSDIRTTLVFMAEHWRLSFASPDHYGAARRG